MIKNQLLIIASAIQENDAHVKYIDLNYEQLKSLFPLTEIAFKALGESEIKSIDQLIYRTSKLQDSIGQRLLPALYYHLEDNDEAKPFIDILHYLEKINVLRNKGLWQLFRNLRNNLTHDYPESLAQTLATLNILVEKINEFIGLYQHLKTYTQKLK